MNNVRRSIIIIVCMLTILSLVGCSESSDSAAETSFINSYTDIPGITAQEIETIEAIKATRPSFTYGQMEETEAFILPDGTKSGFTAKFCDLLTSLFDIDFILEFYDWDALKSGIDSMRIDFTGDLTPTAERMQTYYMTHPIAERSLRVFQYSESNEILTESDITGLRVGSLEGTIDIEHMRDYYQELIFTAVDVRSFDDAAQMLKDGVIDVFITEGVIDPLFDKYGYIKSKELFPLVYTPVSLTTANPDLRTIIDVVNKYLSAGGIDVLFNLYRTGSNEYSRNKLNKSFTDEEKAYLQDLANRGASVKIAYEHDNYPVSFYNTKENQFQGIAIDVLTRISELTGIRFEVVNDMDTAWIEILGMLRSGEVSMVTQLLQAEDRKGSFLWSDKPYATAYYALLSKIGYPDLASYQAADVRVGAVEGSAYESKYKEWFPTNDNLILFSTQDLILDALESGKIDLLMGSNYLLLMQQNYREKPGFKVNIRLGAPMDTYFGFNISESVLCSIIGKAQSYVNTSVVSNGWTSRSYDYMKTLNQQKSIGYMIIASALGLFLILVIAFLIKNRAANVKLDRKVTEMTRDLSTNVAKLQAVISNYSGAIWSVDRDFTITLFDGLYIKVIGVHPDFLEGKSLDVARQKKRHMDIVERVEETFITGKPQDWVSDIDGKMFRSHITPIFDNDGTVISVVGNIDEITEMIKLQKDLETALDNTKEAVNAMEAAQVTISAMFESNPQINILFNSTFKVIDCNPAAYQFMGFNTKKELLDGFLERMIQSIPPYQPDGRPSIPIQERMLTAAKEGSSKFETELHLGGANKMLSVEMKRIPYEDSFAIVAHVFDMTELHEREKELINRDLQLQDAVKEAEEANKAKSVFLSTMSHEIRTPMNAILGITEIQLQNDSLDQDVKDALNKVYASGDLLLGIINDILDLSKIEAGKLELMVDRYEIASLISDTAQLNMMRIGSKPIEFGLTVDANMPAYLYGDELRVKQILNNLLSNAFKYTAEGTVNLSVLSEAIDGTDDKVTLVVGVSDTGQGMTPEQVDRLFDEYSRFNMDANRTTEGTGLGMSITRNLIHLMNGEIFIESNPGKGSTFTVRIPQGKVSSDILGAESAENLHHFRSSSAAQMKRVQITRDPMPYGSVLIVDDVETNIFVARGLLSPYGLMMDSAESGFSAIEKIKNGKSYDIVFMDHMMPKMDGIEATKIIRGMGYTNPIVALTANAVAGQAEIFLGNGFDDYISKPIDVRQLNTVLNKFVRDKQSPEVIEAARKYAGEKKTAPSGGQNDNKKPGIDPRFAEIFARDALKVLATLDEISKKEAYDNEDSLRSYVINVHGIKGALANIGKMDLSAVALKLEAAGRERKIDILKSDTSAFLDSLRAYVEEISPQKKTTATYPADEDKPYLHEKLLAIKAACEEYDEYPADKVLEELKGKAWSQQTNDFLDSIAEFLLHSDFDEIANAIERFLEVL